MIKIFNILSRTFCLLLMIHLLAVSVCDDYILKFINASNIKQTIDVQEDSDNDSNGKSFEFDDLDDKYLVNSLTDFNSLHNFYQKENLSTIAFQYLQIALPQSIHEIPIPPPRE